ncbi:pilus assembly protein [Salana multivorans]
MSDDDGAARRGERGSALVEFLGGTVVILLPLTYLVLTLVQVHAAQFAATGAARDAARLVATADPDHWSALTTAAVELAFEDQGIAVDGSGAVSISCARDCGPGDQVAVSVRASVSLPFAPDGLGYTATADGWSTVDPYRVHE